MDEENPLLQMPRPLVDTFFQLAEEHAINALKRIKESEARIHKIAEYIQLKTVKPKEASLTIATVDGSISPKSSNRLGTRMTILSAGYKIFRNKELIEEHFSGDVFSESSLEGHMFSILSNLKMIKMERIMAIEALKKNPDILLIDGPFLSFLYPPSWVVRFTSEGKKEAQDIVRLTSRLINSKKVIGVIKRSTLRAIDGWLFVQGKEDLVTNTRDKYILTRLMSPSTYWTYDSIMDDPIVYSRAISRAQLRGLKGEEALKWARMILKRDQTRLGIESPPKLRRGYIRPFLETAPFEIEIPEDISINEIAENIIPICNPATGLPFPLDLIDADISLDIKVAKTFADEVEARVLNAENQRAVKDYFAKINPQKDE
ncbi:MAG: DNA double-strand break repair nuclease NurA [Nitrososphaerales archaeon]